MRSGRRPLVPILVAALLVVGCGGGGGTESPPQPPRALWSDPQIAPVRVATIAAMSDDGAGGVIVASPASPDGILLQRFVPGSGWTAPTVAMSDLQRVSVAAFDPGIALFGRDGASWYRRDFNAAGLQPMQPLLAFDGTELGFEIAPDRAVVAWAGVIRGGQLFLQTRELRNGAWSEPHENLMGTAVVTSVAGVRAKEGYVLTTSTWMVSRTSSVMFRRPGDRDYQGVASGCASSLCLVGYHYDFSTFGNPVIEPTGSATVVAYGLSIPNQWLSLDTIPPRNLWPPPVPVGSGAQLVRSDGVPMWLATVGGAVTLWEGTQQSPWDVAHAPCDFASCAAFSIPDSTHVAMLQSPAASSTKIHVSDKGADGRWTTSGATDLASLQAGSPTGTTFRIIRFQASGSRQVLIGTAQPPPLNGSQDPMWVFATTKL